jgi:subtilisin
MQRRIAPLVFALLIAAPVVGPASAAEPPTIVEPSTPPTPEPIVGPAPEVTPQPVVEPTDEPTPDPTKPPLTVVPGPDGAPSVADRYIVMFRDGSDMKTLVARFRQRDGVKVDRRFGQTIKGFSAKLDADQRRDLQADPNVLAVVPDEVIHLTAQILPTGVSRVGGTENPIAAIDGVDQRVDADVAIVDTGIAPNHPDLNVAGGYNCSTSDSTAWRDKNDHGTHVAGIVGALDNGYGVVGVAPGARVWAVKILNDDGYGLISWYVCGLDWILSQRDPNDPSRPLFEAVNMSVSKAGSDDHNCGYTRKDVLHRAICRVVAGGITVVAAAANDSHSASNNIPASYNEVITVSALADSDGKPGGNGGNGCYSWGSYDKDDTFANFSNYGGDVDLIAPGKCIYSTYGPSGYATLSGTSMAAPTVAGAVALYKASRPYATPAEVKEGLRYLGNYNWKTSTDPDSTHEPLLDVSRLGNLGSFSLSPAGSGTPTVEGATTATVPFRVNRSSTFFERVKFAVTSVPSGWSATMGTPSLMGFSATAGTVKVVVPGGAAQGNYTIGIRGTNQGRSEATNLTVRVVSDDPTAQPPTASIVSDVQMGSSTIRVKVAWPAASDPSSDIEAYEVQRRLDDGSWSGSIDRPASDRDVTYDIAYDRDYVFRVRAQDEAGNWSGWAVASDTVRVHAVDDRSSSVVRAGKWHSYPATSGWQGTLTGSAHHSASLSLTFTGHGIAVVAPKSSHRGKVAVWVDGAYVGQVKMKADPAQRRHIIISRKFASGGSHSIVLKPAGTGKHPQFRLDAFAVLK